MSLFSCSDSSDAIKGSWEAKTIDLNGTVLEASALGGMSFSYNDDGTFAYEESGNKEGGTFEINDNAITLTFKADGRKVTQAIESQTDNELVVAYEDHGMKRKVTLLKK